MNILQVSKHLPKILSTGVIAVMPFFGGCASVPDITINYRPVKWTLLVTVAHTITCNKEGKLALVERGASFMPFYSAASIDSRYRIQLKNLDRYFADADIMVALTDDGRLKSINQSTTGQGESIAKNAITAVATVSALPLSTPLNNKLMNNVTLFKHNVFEKQANAKPSKICDIVKSYDIIEADKVAQVSLVQTAIVTSDSNMSVDAISSEDQKDLLNKLKVADLDLKAKVIIEFAKDELQPIEMPKDKVASDEVPLTLQRMISLKASVIDVQGSIGSKSIPVPTTGVFVVPIPKAALFGKQSFSLVLAESGRITNIGYGRTTGVPGALGTLSSLAGAETTEDNIEVAAMKAAADLIAQQQRYNNCKLKPIDCK